MSYRIPNAKDKDGEYTGGKLVKISRSVQRLTLLLGIEEQEAPLVVEGGQVVKACKEKEV